MYPASRCSALGLLLLGAIAITAPAADWPQWRGPNFDGVSPATGLATEWGPERNIRWRTPLPGPAGSTPVVSGGRVFVSSVDGKRVVLVCFSTNGDELWRQPIGRGNRRVQGDEGNYASPSPSTDGDSVVVLMGNGELASFGVDGAPRWRFNVEERYGKLDLQFGLTSSPVLHGGRVYVQLIHGDGEPGTHEARVLAVDAATGDELWSHPRVTGAANECEHAYTSPVVYGLAAGSGDPFLVTHGADFLIGHALDDGRELWRCGGMNPQGNYHRTLRFVSSPAVGDGLIVAPTAKKGPVLGVLPGGEGDITDTTSVAWRMPRNTPDVPSPLIHDGLVYLCGENGVLTCVEAASGETVYRERLVNDRHRASPVLADGKLYCTSRNGVVSVVRAGRDFALLAENDLGEPISSSPAIAGGVIYLRTFDALYAVAP